MPSTQQGADRHEVLCRFKTFTEESMPVVDKFASEGKAHKISAVPPPEEVFLEVEKVLEPLFGEGRSSAAEATAPSTVAPAVATTATPDFAALATAGQPVTLYSKRPSANWVSPSMPPSLHPFPFAALPSPFITQRAPGCLYFTMSVNASASAPSHTILAPSKCL